VHICAVLVLTILFVSRRFTLIFPLCIVIS
jgi:hypothetical protein